VKEPPILPSAGSSPSQPQGQELKAPKPHSEKTSVFDQKWFVLAAIFLALMFLGLPLLWRCPAFSKLEKFVWTIATLIYSAVLIWIFILIMTWSWRNITEAM
jgi:hypothetical protein